MTSYKEESVRRCCARSRIKRTKGLVPLLLLVLLTCFVVRSAGELPLQSRSCGNGFAAYPCTLLPRLTSLNSNCGTSWMSHAIAALAVMPPVSACPGHSRVSLYLQEFEHMQAGVAHPLQLPKNPTQ
jgi:hypothetical protein